MIWAGTFEPSFSRNQRLARLLELAGAEVVEVRVRLWDDDRIGVVLGGKLRTAARAALVYPRLLWRLWRLPPPDLYLVSYPGWFDMPAVAAVARLKRRPVVFDPFFLLYETTVEDRALVRPGSLFARLVGWVDRLALRLAEGVIADTSSHLDYYRQFSGGRLRRGTVLEVGADDAVFRPASTTASEGVLFYGTFVPLQGVEVIVNAAHLLPQVEFKLIGSGQDRGRIEEDIRTLGITNVTLVDSIPLDHLPAHIAESAVCLGIFGTSAKAGRVIPHKLFECLAVGRPVVTRASPAVAESFSEDELVTVAPGDPEALAQAISGLLVDTNKRERIAAAGARAYQERFQERVLSRHLAEALATWAVASRR
ncbi:MAG TPA: glycosyltransferase [Acidimicrobiia bacterium]|nr:glycosyltransferase [Acidimicrobiia bacterium]